MLQQGLQAGSAHDQVVDLQQRVQQVVAIAGLSFELPGSGKNIQHRALAGGGGFRESARKAAQVEEQQRQQPNACQALASQVYQQPDPPAAFSASRNQNEHDCITPQCQQQRTGRCQQAGLPRLPVADRLVRDDQHQQVSRQRQRRSQQHPRVGRDGLADRFHREPGGLQGGRRQHLEQGRQKGNNDDPKQHGAGLRGAVNDVNHQQPQQQNGQEQVRAWLQANRLVSQADEHHAQRRELQHSRHPAHHHQQRQAAQVRAGAMRSQQDQAEQPDFAKKEQ